MRRTCALAPGPIYAWQMSTALDGWIGPRWPWIALLVSLAMLAAAHAFERFGGLPPCALCYRQREVYWGAAALAVLALGAQVFWPTPLVTRVSGVLLALAFATGAIVAGYHAGVEWKFWEGPRTCAAGAAIIPTDLSAALDRPIKVVPCDEPAWTMFGISMAGYNALISLGLAGLSVLSAVRAARSELHDDG